MKSEYIEKIYAGWLAKIIGIRLGAPIEGWTYEKIKNIYGELDDYPVAYKEFAADDDSNGPLFFLRALEDTARDYDLKSSDVAEALLNYAPFEHGFFWWGGYGVSTEHTAYLNLRNGIPAPRSGSIEQNGYTAAEQIGGQIFIDTWGLVTPGNPDLAAKYAKEAAGVTHGGNGIYGGIFIAACISFAFDETDIRKILEKGLSYIPHDSEYARVVRAVMQFYEEKPLNWRLCFEYIHENFGYDKYPGNCHIIPNIAVMILALLYGEGDFSDTINICNMCGWDTDCNVGNVATIMGVRNGLSGIDYNKWRRPVNDLLICSSVVGSLNIMDIPYGAAYITKLAYGVAGEKLPNPWEELISKRIDSCHFEYEGSTHAMRIRVDGPGENARKEREVHIANSAESAYTGKRSLKFMVKPIEPAENMYVYKKTYYESSDFDDSRYDPCFSPLVYPRQTLHGSVMVPEYGQEAIASLYIHDAHTGRVFTGDSVELTKGKWRNLHYEIPHLEGVLIDEVGFCISAKGRHTEVFDFVGFVDDLYADGNPDYTVELNKEKEDVWTGLHREVTQFTKLKGLMYLHEGQLNLSCADFAEAYTGHHDWQDYQAEFTFTPLTGEHHFVLARVQGAIRSYAVGLLPDNTFAILKNENPYRTLVQTPFEWTHDMEYTITVRVQDAKIIAEVSQTAATVTSAAASTAASAMPSATTTASASSSPAAADEKSKKAVLEFTDDENPYLKGAIGVAVQGGSHAKYRRIVIS